MPNITLKTFLQEKHLWVLILVVIIYFHRPLFFGESFFFRDIISEDLPQKQFLVDSIRARIFPLWDTSLFGGKPYFADLTTSTLNPLNVLYLFFPTVRAFTLSIICNILGCAVFAYFAARSIGLQSMASLIVGVVYAFCGYSLSLANLSSLFFDMAYLPLFLACWHIFLSTGKRRWFMLAVVMGVCQVFNGSHEINAISFVLLLGWTTLYQYPVISLGKKLILWLLLGVFVAGVGAFQILPAAELLLKSSRGAQAESQANTWSLAPQRLPELVFPGFLMQVDPLQGTLQYWGSEIEENRMPFILSIYMGGTVLMLTLAGGINTRKNSLIPYKLRVFLLCVATLSLLVSLGRFLPVVGSLYPYIAKITLSRFPIRMFVAAIFPIAILAGYCSEVHFGNPPAPPRRKHMTEPTGVCHAPQWPSFKILAVFWSVWGFLLVFIMFFWFSKDFADWFQLEFFKRPPDEITRRALRLSFGQAGATWLLTTLLYQYRHLRITRWQHGMLACIVIVDLLSSGRYINQTVPEELLTAPPAVVHEISNIIDDGRLFRTADVYNGNLGTFRFPSRNVLWFWPHRSYLETLVTYTPALFGIPSIFHPDPNGLSQPAIMKLTSLIGELPWNRKLPLLSAGNVTAILTTEELSLSGIRQIAKIPNRTETPLYLYKNEAVAGRVTFVTAWIILDSETEIIQAMLAVNYDPRYHVALLASPTTSSLPALPKRQNADIFRQPEILSSTSGRFSIETDNDGFLVFSEPFYPGWHVRLNGKTTPLIRANLAFSAIFLPAGTHDVERYYLPATIIIGAIVSLCMCVTLGIAVYTGWLIRLNSQTGHITT